MLRGHQKVALNFWEGLKHWGLKYFPENINRYFEPFLGSGSILYAVRELYPDCKVYGSDIYKPLIDIFKNVSKNPLKLKNKYRHDWTKLQKDFPN